jgi:hypothetical protein
MAGATAGFAGVRSREAARRTFESQGRYTEMKRNLRGFAAAGSLFLAVFAAEAGFAQKQGGILKMYNKGSDDVRIPGGPLVAYYGTYTVNEADNTITYKIEHAANSLFDGATRTQKITFQNDVMTTTGSDVKTPQGTITPVNEWKKAK